MTNRKLGISDREFVTVSAHRFRYAARFVARDIAHIHLSGGVRVEPIKEGEKGVLLIATDGRRMVVIHDDDGYCRKPVTVHASEAMLKACETPVLPFLHSEGERLHASLVCSLPPQIVPDVACFSPIGAFVLSKASREKGEEGDAEDCPPSIWNEFAHDDPKHWDYATTFLTIDYVGWRGALRQTLEAEPAPVMTTEFYPDHIADFAMWPVSPDPEQKPTLRIDWRGPGGVAAIVTISEAPEMIGLLMPFRERDMPQAHRPFLDFLREATAQDAPEGHPETPPPDRFGEKKTEKTEGA